MAPFRYVSNDENHPSSPDSSAASTNPLSAVVLTLNTNRYELPWQISSIPPSINTNNFAASYNTDIYQIPRPQSSLIPSNSHMITPSASTNYNLADPNHPIVTAASTPVMPNDNNDSDQDSDSTSPSPPHPSFPLNIEGPQRTSPTTSTNYNYPIFTAASSSSGVPNYNTGLCNVPLQPSPIPPHLFSFLNINPDLNQAPPQRSLIPPHPSYDDMISEAISALDEPNGSSKEEISRHILRNYPKLTLCNYDELLKANLKNLKKEGTLYARKSYKLAVNENQPPKTPKRGRPTKPKPRGEQPQPLIKRSSGSSVATSKKRGKKYKR